MIFFFCGTVLRRKKNIYDYVEIIFEFYWNSLTSFSDCLLFDWKMEEWKIDFKNWSEMLHNKILLWSKKLRFWCLILFLCLELKEKWVYIILT